MKASMQRFELSPTDTLKLNREPLLIVRYLSYNPVSQLYYETGKIETLSYLCLAHSTWARWRRSWSLQVDHLSWLRFAWWRLKHCSPILHYGRASLRHIFTWTLSLNGWQASSLGFLRDAPLELALRNIDDDHHFTSSIMGHMKSSFDASP